MAPRARRAVVIAGLALALAGLLVVGFLVWALTPYRADRDASLAAWRSNAVEITGTDRAWVIRPTIAGGEGEEYGLVFVPGARVEPSAYLNTMSGITVRTGMTVVIARPTLNLPIIDTRPLATFTNDAPGIERWIVGGHSLGGVRACQWAHDAQLPDAPASPEIVGLMLLGSYCVDDLSDAPVAVTSFVATNDRISTPDDIASRASLLPRDTVTVTLDGANHASFGDYGAQFGDGEATVATDEVHARVSEATAELLGRIGR